jgi:hypothetical protein
MLFEKARARRVVSGLFGFSVAVAVDLDAQASGSAIEIGDKPPEQYMLATDVDPGLVVSEKGPETLLGEGERVPQFSGAVQNGRGDSQAGLTAAAGGHWFSSPWVDFERGFYPHPNPLAWAVALQKGVRGD